MPSSRFICTVSLETLKIRPHTVAFFDVCVRLPGVQVIKLDHTTVTLSSRRALKLSRFINALFGAPPFQVIALDSFIAPSDPATPPNLDEYTVGHTRATDR